MADITSFYQAHAHFAIARARLCYSSATIGESFLAFSTSSQRLMVTILPFQDFVLPYLLDSSINQHTDLSPILSKMVLPPLPPHSTLFSPTLSANAATLSSPRIPPELCDYIIDELGRWETVNMYGRVVWDIESHPLKCCALVCKGWRPRAQLWLFRRIKLTSMRSFRGLQEQLNHRPEFLSVVRVVSLACGGDRGKYPVHNLVTAVASLMRRCPRAHSLLIVNYGFQFDSQRERRCSHWYLPFHLRLHSAYFRQSFSIVTTLALWEISFSSKSDFLAFIFSFTALESLTIFGLWWHSTPGSPQSNAVTSKRRRSPLEKLRILRLVCVRNICMVLS